MSQTRHFGLNRLTQAARLEDEGHKFGVRDRDILDALLWTLFSHDHSTQGVVAGPSKYADVVVSTSGGEFPAGQDQYYRISFIDQYGNETFASSESLAELPDKLAPFGAPTLTVASTGGTLGVGSYHYAVGSYQLLSVTRRTTAGSFATAQVLSGSTNKITLALDELEPQATGWDIWRRGPSDSDFYLLAQKQGVNEVQEVYNGASSGTFTLSFDAETTVPIAYNAAAVDIEAALEILPSIVDVTVTGVGTSGDPWVITFIDPAYQDVPELVADDTGLTGGTSTVTVTQEGSTLTFVDDGSYSPTVTITRPALNDTNGENTVTVTIADVDKPLDRNISGWRIYRTNRSGVYAANSLLATITEPITEGGVTLKDSFEDTGLGLLEGIPLDQSAVPSAIPALFNATGLHFYLYDTAADLSDGDYAQFVVPSDFNVRRMDVFFADAPNTSAGNYVTVRITDRNPVNEVQEVWNDATGGTFTLTFDGQTTTAINYNAASAAVESALEALSTITNVTVTGAGTEASPWVVTFVNPGAQNVKTLVPNDTNLTGHILGTTVTTTVQGSPTTLAQIDVIGTAQHWGKVPDYWAFVGADGYQEAEAATVSAGSIVVDADASDGNAYQITTASGYSRWTIGNITTGTYVFRFVLAQGASNNTVQLKIIDLDVPTTHVDVSVNVANDYTLYEYELTISNATNNMQMEMNGNSTAVYFLDSFAYAKVRPDPVLFQAGETVYVEVVSTGSPPDSGNRANLVVW